MGETTSRFSFFFFFWFYPAFLLAVTAGRPGSDCNECLQKNDGLIPSSWTNAQCSAGETELQLVVFHSSEKKEGHSPKHMSRTNQKEFTLDLYVTAHSRGLKFSTSTQFQDLLHFSRYNGVMFILSPPKCHSLLFPEKTGCCYAKIWS